MKLRATTYTFVASAKTIDCALFTSLEAIQIITNVTDNIIIYNFADSNKGGSLSGTVLTLAYDTTLMSNTDKLMILVEDGTDSVGIDDGGNSITIDTTSLPLPTGASTSANQTTIIGHLDGVEGLLTTIDADTSALAGAVSGTEVQVDVLTMPTTTVQATNLDIRDLTSVSDSVEVKQATASNLKAEMWGGAKGATVAAVITSTTDGADHNLLDVTVRDSAGNDLELVKDQDNYNSANHGMVIYGVDDGAPQKYRQLRVEGVNGDGETPITSGAMSSEAYNMVFNGTTFDRMRGDIANGVLVNLGSNNDVTVTGSLTSAGNVTNAGTFAVQSTNQANSGVDIGDVTINNAAGASAVNIQDGGNTITVDGTVTANATLAAETTKVIGTVNIAAAQTLATVTTVGAVTSITNALPAGTNAIGKLAANSGVDIGDVDVTSVIAGTGATNLGKAEDAAHTTGDTGVMMLGVRSASPTDRSAGPTDGDYEPFAVNEVGAIWVSETSSINGGDSTATASTADGSTALTNSAQVIKASAGKLTGYYIYNPNSSATYVNFYNTAAASVTVGTTNPLFNICIPATSAANLSGLKVTFGTAMSWSATTTGGGNTAPTTALEATCWYK